MNYLTQSQAAAMCGLSPQALGNLALRGHGPTYKKLNHGARVYLDTDIQAWIAAQAQDAEKERLHNLNVTQAQQQAAYDHQTATIRRFLHTHAVPTTTGHTTKTDLYDAYTEYTKRTGLVPTGKTSFFKYVHNDHTLWGAWARIVPPFVQIRIDGVQTRVVLGVALAGSAVWQS